MGKGRKHIDISGTRFGRLFVNSFSFKNAHGTYFYDCTCSCGTKGIYDGSRLKNGKTQSCGCLFRELSSKRRITHGLSKTKAYQTWRAMINRCNNPKDKNYPQYGFRGIGVCDRWLNFINFFNDMGERPKGKEIDRINNDLGYNPDNCQWTTSRENSNNTRKCLKLGYKGTIYTQSELAEKMGIPVKRLQWRLSHGWTITEAVSAKRHQKKKSLARVIEEGK